MRVRKKLKSTKCKINFIGLTKPQAEKNPNILCVALKQLFKVREIGWAMLNAVFLLCIKLFSGKSISSYKSVLIIYSIVTWTVVFKQQRYPLMNLNATPI